MRLAVEQYLRLRESWPNDGQHILAQFDHESIWVYQAYRKSIAKYAVGHQKFGGEFSFSRMTWIKPNFLWMMYRSGWAMKPDQEHILAIRVGRPLFDQLVLCGVSSSYRASGLVSHEDWQRAVTNSDVRIQWDPDHDPSGAPVERRAIQIGVRGQTLRDMNDRAILEICDVTEFVHAQRVHSGRRDWSKLLVPYERPYDRVTCPTGPERR